MAFGQSGFGSKEERMDPAGGLKAFAGGRGAPAPIQNSEEKEMRDKAINSIADTSLKTVGGVEGAHLANFGKAAKGLGQAIMGTTPIAPPTLGAGIGSGTAIMGAPAAAGGIGSAMAGVGSAMLPFAGPLALAALPFLFNKGTESVGGNTMETDDINEIANNYAMMTGGSSRVMPRPVMGGAPFMDRPADVDTAGGVQPFMAATPNLGKSSESQLLNKFYSPGMGYGLAGIGEGLFDSAYMRKAPPVVNQVPSMENVSGRDVSTEFPGVYTAPRAPVNVEMTTPSYREVNPLDYHMRQWYGMPNIMKGVDALKSIWGTPVANESNHGYYKGGTHKVAGIDPQKYARGEDDVSYNDMYPDNFGLTDFGKQEWIPSPDFGSWGVDSLLDEQFFEPKDYSKRAMPGGGTQVANVWDNWSENKLKYLIDLYKQQPRPDILRDINYLNWEHRHLKGDNHEAWNRFPEDYSYNAGTSSVPVPPNTAGYLKDALLKENMQRELKNYLQKSGPNFQGIADQGKNIQRNMKAREVQSMLNNLQRQPRLPLSSVGNLSKTLFKGGPLGAAISTAMTPTMAADATWSDAEWSGMMGGNKAMSDREMKQQLHSQKMRQNEEAHRAKMMAQ